MTWQDELRRLEDDLANGRVSAEDYRIRRDQLLSSANASPPPDTSMDNTQIIPPISDDAGATQVVRGQQGGQQRPPQQQGGPAQQQQQPYQQQGYQYQQWQAGQQGMSDQPPENENDPPWQGDEFPPLAGTGSSSWVKQGPETAEQHKSAKGRIIGIVAGVVLIAVLAVGAWLLFGQDSGGGQPQAGGGQQQAQQQGNDKGDGQQPKPKPKKPDQLGLIEPKGQAEAHQDVKDLQTLEGANYLTPDERQAYTDAATSKVVFKVSHQGDDTIVLLAAKAGAPEGAKEAAKALNEAQLSNGMKPMPAPPKGVYVAQLQPKPGQPNNEIRAHYVHGSTIVRVHVSGKDPKAVQQEFEQTLRDQLKALPADG